MIYHTCSHPGKVCLGGSQHPLRPGDPGGGGCLSSARVSFLKSNADGVAPALNVFRNSQLCSEDTKPPRLGSAPLATFASSHSLILILNMVTSREAPLVPLPPHPNQSSSDALALQDPAALPTPGVNGALTLAPQAPN